MNGPQRMCRCGIAATHAASRSAANPGRWYFNCSRGTDGGCTFFEWDDATPRNETAARGGGRGGARGRGRGRGRGGNNGTTSWGSEGNGNGNSSPYASPPPPYTPTPQTPAGGGAEASGWNQASPTPLRSSLASPSVATSNAAVPPRGNRVSLESFEGGQFIIGYEYSAEFKDWCKAAFPGIRYDGGQKKWLLPVNRLGEVIDTLRREFPTMTVEIAPDLQAHVGPSHSTPVAVSGISNPIPTPPAALPAPPRTPNFNPPAPTAPREFAISVLPHPNQPSSVLIRFDYDQQLNTVLHSRGAKWDAQHKCFAVAQNAWEGETKRLVENQYRNGKKVVVVDMTPFPDEGLPQMPFVLPVPGFPHLAPDPPGTHAQSALPAPAHHQPPVEIPSTPITQRSNTRSALPPMISSSPVPLTFPTSQPSSFPAVPPATSSAPFATLSFALHPSLPDHLVALFPPEPTITCLFASPAFASLGVAYTFEGWKIPKRKYARVLAEVLQGLGRNASAAQVRWKVQVWEGEVDVEPEGWTDAEAEGGEDAEPRRKRKRHEGTGTLRAEKTSLTPKRGSQAHGTRSSRRLARSQCVSEDTEGANAGSGGSDTDPGYLTLPVIEQSQRSTQSSQGSLGNGRRNRVVSDEDDAAGLEHEEEAEGGYGHGRGNGARIVRVARGATGR